MKALDALPRIHPRTRRELRRWLTRHHLAAKGAWLIMFNKKSGEPRIEYDDIVCELLCFGWIDSRPAKLDELRSMLLCTPRRPASRWSGPNKERALRMMKERRMATAGLKLIELAMESGTWSALDAIEALEEPPALARALDENRAARRFWNAFPRSARRGILEWISTAKRPETRARRVAETVACAAENIRANQWPRRT